MKALKAIIVDDENLARRGLALRLKDLPQIELIGECSNGEEALQAIAEHSPELVFLDIQMPGMSGFDVIARLQTDNMPMIIFVTAFDQFAVEAFKVHAVDYVLKPIEDDRLWESVERAIEHRQRTESIQTKEKLVELVMGITGESASSIEEMASTNTAPQRWPERISIKDGSEIQFIKVADIQWVDAAGDYMCIHACGNTHVMRITMKQLVEMLNPAIFLRIHRSCIVNSTLINAVQSLCNGEYLLTLEGGSQLKVSRSYRDKVKNLLQS